LLKILLFTCIKGKYDQKINYVFSKNKKSPENPGESEQKYIDLQICSNIIF